MSRRTTTKTPTRRPPMRSIEDLIALIAEEMPEHEHRLYIAATFDLVNHNARRSIGVTYEAAVIGAELQTKASSLAELLRRIRSDLWPVLQQQTAPAAHERPPGLQPLPGQRTLALAQNPTVPSL